MGDIEVTVGENDVTKIDGPWYEKLRVELPKLLQAAQRYHDDASKREAVKQERTKKNEAARQARVREAALKEYNG